MTTEADGTATWISNHVRYACWKAPTKGGGVYVASVGGTALCELSFSELRKQWEVIVGNPWWIYGGEGKDSPKNWEAVPATAIAWISKDIPELGSTRLARAPWLEAPATCQKYFPHTTTRLFAEIEQALVAARGVHPWLVGAGHATIL